MFRFVVTTVGGFRFTVESEVNDSDVVGFRAKKQGWQILSVLPVR